MMGIYLFYVYFLLCCLFAGNGDHGLLFFYDTCFVVMFVLDAFLVVWSDLH
jgi:hypothetical protein